MKVHFVKTKDDWYEEYMSKNTSLCGRDMEYSSTPVSKIFEITKDEFFVYREGDRCKQCSKKLNPTPLSLSV